MFLPIFSLLLLAGYNPVVVSSSMIPRKSEYYNLSDVVINIPQQANAFDNVSKAENIDFVHQLQTKNDIVNEYRPEKLNKQEEIILMILMISFMTIMFLVSPFSCLLILLPVLSLGLRYH